MQKNGQENQRPSPHGRFDWGKGATKKGVRRAEFAVNQDGKKDRHIAVGTDTAVGCV
jgi:hypothetical protein